MRFQRCANPKCLRPYQVNEFDKQYLGIVEATTITCPHCGRKESQNGGVFLSHAMTAEQEAEFNRRYPLTDRSDTEANA